MAKRYAIWNEHIFTSGESFGFPMRVYKNGKELSFSSKQSAMKCIVEVENKSNVINNMRMYVKEVK